jgi:hypothetical protein
VILNDRYKRLIERFPLAGKRIIPNGGVPVLVNYQQPASLAVFVNIDPNRLSIPDDRLGQQ